MHVCHGLAIDVFDFIIIVEADQFCDYIDMWGAADIEPQVLEFTFHCPAQSTGDIIFDEDWSGFDECVALAGQAEFLEPAVPDFNADIDGMRAGDTLDVWSWGIADVNAIGWHSTTKQGRKDTETHNKFFHDFPAGTSAVGVAYPFRIGLSCR